MTDLVNHHLDIITSFYGNTTAKRSEVPYINHIVEGLKILEHIGSDDYTKASYCVHPIFQVPDYLETCIHDQLYDQMDKYVILLTMEYRNKANAFVCRERTDHYTIDDLPKMVLPEVRDMLIADKVQNYKDFLLYHSSTHDRRDELDRYFNLWFEHLGIDYIDTVSAIEL